MEATIAKKRKKSRAQAVCQYVHNQRNASLEGLDILQCAFAGLYLPLTAFAYLDQTAIANQFSQHTENGKKEFPLENVLKYRDNIPEAAKSWSIYDLAAYLILQDVPDNDTKDEVARILEATKAKLLDIFEKKKQKSLQDEGKTRRSESRKRTRNVVTNLPEGGPTKRRKHSIQGAGSIQDVDTTSLVAPSQQPNTEAMQPVGPYMDPSTQLQFGTPDKTTKRTGPTAHDNILNAEHLTEAGFSFDSMSNPFFANSGAYFESQPGWLTAHPDAGAPVSIWDPTQYRLESDQIDEVRQSR